MANVSRPFGFRPERYLSGAMWNGQTQLYAFSASNTDAAFNGDCVSIDTTNRSTALTDVYAPGIPLITAAVTTLTTNPFRGVIAGFVPQPEFNMSVSASLGLMYRVASTARYAWVVDDPAVIFEAQESGNSYTSATSNGINKCMDISYTAGNTTTGVSGTQLSGTATTSGVKPFRLLRYTQRVDNFNFTAADSSSYAHWDVIIANSDLAQANVGA